MIQIKKEVTAVIDGKDFKALSNVCEMARVLLQERADTRRPGAMLVSGMTFEEVGEAKQFMDKVFNA